MYIYHEAFDMREKKNFRNKIPQFMLIKMMIGSNVITISLISKSNIIFPPSISTNERERERESVLVIVDALKLFVI